METETKGSENKIAMYLFILFLFVFIFFLLPDSWFKSKVSYSKENNDDALVLLNKKLSKDYLNAPSDASKPNSIPNWKKALLDSVDPSIINATRTKEQIETQKVLDDPNNLTSQIAKNSYTISAYLAQQGVKADSKTIDTISQNIINDSLNSIKNTSKTYSRKDFKLTSKNDTKTLKTYGNDFAVKTYNVFVARTKIGGNSELDPLTDYYKNNDPTSLRKYDVEISAFKKLRDDLLKMTVPESMIDIHAKNTTTIDNYLTSLIVFSNTNKDPVKTVVEMEKYKKNLEEFYMNIKEYNALFAKQNIYFTKSEAGYVFFNEKMANFDFK